MCCVPCERIRLRCTGQAIDKGRDRFNTTGVPVISSTTQHVTSGQAAPRLDQHLARNSGLYFIGIFKLAKAIFFLGVSLGALHFIHHSLPGTVERIIRELHFDPENRLVDLVLDEVGQITHHRLRMISLGTSLYAMLCTTEAYGLLLRRVWAEYVTLWLSISFVPWELYELVRRPTWWHFGILLVNLVIVAYLLWLLRRNKVRRLSTVEPS